MPNKPTKKPTKRPAKKTTRETLPATVQDGENAAEETIDREEQFILCLCEGKSIKDAALSAGYSPSYAQKAIYKRLRDPKFQGRLREKAIENDALSIPAIQYIEKQVIEHLLKNPLDLPKYARTLREKKQIAGILAPDHAPGQSVVNVGNVQQLMLQIHSAQNNAQDVIDVTPRNNTDSDNG